MLDVLKVW